MAPQSRDFFASSSLALTSKRCAFGNAKHDMTPSNPFAI